MPRVLWVPSLLMNLKHKWGWELNHRKGKTSGQKVSYICPPEFSEKGTLGSQGLCLAVWLLFNSQCPYSRTSRSVRHLHYNQKNQLSDTHT